MTGEVGGIKTNAAVAGMEQNIELGCMKAEIWKYNAEVKRIKAEYETDCF